MEAEADVVHAGFLRRWAALFLDQLILIGAYYVVLFAVMLAAGAASGFSMNGDEPPPWLVLAYTGASALYFVGAGAYYSLFESSASQATIGKMALGIKVTDEHGNRLSLPHALGRWFAAALSYLTLYLGFFAAGFTARKQALHDLVAKTLVVDKWAYTDTPERQQRSLHGCLIAFLVVMVLMVGVAVLGILAAIAIPAYQDYVDRAKFAGALAAAAPVKLLMQAGTDDGPCPANGEAGIGSPESYRTTMVDRIETGVLESGNCAVTVWLPGRGGPASTDYLLLEREPSSSLWTCTSSLPDRRLPTSCR